MSDDLDATKKRHGLGELTWTKVTEAYLSKYEAFASVMFRYSELRFNCIVIDRHIVDYRTYHNNDEELAFYKFYFQLLSRNTNPAYRYAVYPDYVLNRRSERLDDLQRVVNNYHNKRSGCRPIQLIEPRSSKECDLIQLADLISGAVQAAWNKRVTRNAKMEFCSFVARNARLQRLDKGTPIAAHPINIWLWQPAKRYP